MVCIKRHTTHGKDSSIDLGLIGPDRPTAEKNADQCIREWVSLNVLVAHLTRVHAVFLNTYAVRTFHRAFGPDPNEDKLDYQIPASAAWISNLGEQIYRWCRSAREVGEEVSELFD
jgi:hypothetical protein